MRANDQEIVITEMLRRRVNDLADTTIQQCRDYNRTLDSILQQISAKFNDEIQVEDQQQQAQAWPSFILKTA